MARKKRVTYTKVNWQQLMEDYHSDDIEVSKAAVEVACLALKGFIISLMKKKYPTYISKENDDLIEAGYTAIIKNIKNYDPQMAKPTTFFRVYIEQEMMLWLNLSINQTSIYYQTINNKIQAAIRFFESNGLPWNDIKISEYAHISLSTVKNTMLIFNKSATLELKEEIKIGGTEETVILEASGSPEDDCLAREKMEMLYNCIDKHLTYLEKEVIYYSYGCCGYPELSQRDIGERLGVSGNVVRRTYSKAVNKLLNSELGNLFKDRYSDSEYLLNDDISFFPSSDKRIQEPELIFNESIACVSQAVPI